MKKDLVLLHGALGSAAQFESSIPFLEDAFNLHLFDFPGHGKDNTVSELTIGNCANYLKDKLESLLDPVIFGYSMGGYVALYANSMNLINPSFIITLATKFAWSNEFAAKEVEMMDAENLSKVAPAFIENLKVQHGNKWNHLLDKTKNLMLDLGENKLLTENSLSTINTPTCISVGSRDKMVSIEESLWASRSIPKSDFCVYPKLQHPIERINWKQVSESIKLLSL